MSRHPRSEDVTINLTPMIDVVFLLVIFFMVGSKFSENEGRIEVNVPAVGEMRSITRIPDERVVTVAMDGSITMDGVSMNMDQLKQTLANEMRNYPDMRVAVRGEAKAEVQQLMEVMNAVSLAGIDQIGLSTKRIQR